jgi:thiamine transporter
MFPFLLVIFKEQDGAYVLQQSGYVIFSILILLLVVIAASFMTREDKENDMRTVRLTVSAISLALAFVTSFFKLFELPLGGSITLFSMFFVCFIGYLYGPVTGLTAAFAYSILQFLQSGGSYVLSIPQVLLDYIFAFTALGIAGFWYKKKNGLLIGYIVACIARGVFASLAGYLFWMDYMPESFPKSLSFLYPLAYNYLYIGVEMALTIVVLLLPPVNKAIRMIAYEATQNRRGGKTE